MAGNIKQALIKNVIKHQTLWGAALLLSWFVINMLLLATTNIMEHNRAGVYLPWWQPFCWEISSLVILLLLIPLGIFIHDRWLNRLPLKYAVLLHGLLTLPFSILHVTGMVGIRKLWYGLMNVHYDFGNVPWEFFYEYRKDAHAYFTILLVIFGYRLIVRRLQGEATYLAEYEEPDSHDQKPQDNQQQAKQQQDDRQGRHEDIKEDSQEPKQPDSKKGRQDSVTSVPERLLIKKVGREFLIPTRDVEWVEASGNYANLHVKHSVYPMRITMDKLEKRLPENFARIHRSIIVNLNQVQQLEALDSGDYEISLHSGVKLALSRRYRENFKNLHSFE